MAEGRNYVRQGDAFTRLVESGQGPRTVAEWTNRNTGRQYFARVPVHACTALPASVAAEMMREYAADANLKDVTTEGLASMLVIDWNPLAHHCRPRLSSEPKELKAEVRLSLTVTETGRPGQRGARYWLVCPHCSRRCGAVYASPWERDGSRLLLGAVVGCRVCLGLTDESRQSHKTPRWASAVIQRRPYAQAHSGRYPHRGTATLERASAISARSDERLYARFLRFYPTGEE